MQDPTTSWLMAAFALALVLAALWLAAALARRLGLAARLGARPPQGKGRRMAVVESAPLDARRRAVILRLDGREALIVTGGPQDLFLGWL